MALAFGMGNSLAETEADIYIKNLESKYVTGCSEKYTQGLMDATKSCVRVLRRNKRVVPIKREAFKGTL